MSRTGLSRRNMLKSAAALGACAFPMINIGRYAMAGAEERTYSARAMGLVERSLVIDMLAIPRLDFRPEAYSRPLSEAAVAEFRASGINAIHNAVGLIGRDDALTFLAAQQGFAGRQPGLFQLVDTAEDLDRAKRDRRVAMIMGFQNAPFDAVEDVAFFHGLGLRCAQLTYNNQNLIGSGSTDRVDGGVSTFGTEIVRAMNQAGMLVDVSHSGDRTTLDAIELSTGPIAFTHSNCRALCNHPRNKTDDAIRALAAKGGVMGITGVRMFIRDRDPTNVGHMVDHIEHVIRLAGIEHVGIGSDADLNGYDDMPPDQYRQLKASYDRSYAFREKIDIDGFDHPRKIYDLTEELIRRGHSDAHIALILGGNFRRLLGAVWTRPQSGA
ncbi:membrane dipeptidase [Sphingosinicella sp. LHD-64]|uniref:dipeptidase n=1 Tax=Sphingosinicella sp. LHD-64 TaxID=3072139 RepID=UPI00280F295B|nr:membrane dipeptidase [Sphingosinicella sp. LHD-64]MDQ8756603.1 membrane dipeptidase [Sphingosinicella sp. LHD-64]